MRKEHISYFPELPITISYANIMQYPIHWHDSIEILFVLKGTIDVTIETGTYTVEEKEIEIVNFNEAHSIKSADKENRVLIFNIDLNFFEKYYDDVKNVFFYVNSSIEGIQEDEKYYTLRKYLSILLCEVVKQNEDYDEYIHDTLLDLLFHLINNFHYLLYEEESLKDDEVQFERYHRIGKYISNNYMNKVSLQDIAKQEFLSSQYLSYKIKNTFGYNFNDFLNLTRVEESTKLLLDTDKNISEISDEVGFSHVRYFNKHFKRYYKCTPMQYRKKYKVDDEKLEKLKKITFFPIEEGLSEVSTYLEDYDRFTYENRIIKVDIDPTAEGEKYERPLCNIIDLGNAYELIDEKNKVIVSDIQKKIGFKYGIIRNIFSKELGVYSGKSSHFTNWRKIHDILEFVISLGLKPIFVIDKEKKDIKNIYEEFIDYFTEQFGEDEFLQWESCKSDSYNPIYDTCYMLPYIIHNAINGQNDLCFKAFDTINPETVQNSELFCGGNGLVTIDGIKKPLYYAYYFLSKLGSTVIAKGEGYVVTKEGKNIQALLYSYDEEPERLKKFEDVYKGRGYKKTIERKFSLNINNMLSDYKITKYEISEKCGSAYNNWLSMGKPIRLNKEDRELLRMASFPKTKFTYAKKATIYNMIAEVIEYGAVLITFESVQK